MCNKQNQRLAAFLKERFDAAMAQEASLKEEDRKPLMACAILTDTGNIFGSIVYNMANHDNPDGASPIEDVLDILEQHKQVMRTDFRVAVVAVTTSIDGKTSEFIPFDWDFFVREKRTLTEAGVGEVLHVCPETEQHMMLEL